jgi:putative transposase
MRRQGRAHVFVANKLRSYGAAVKVIGDVDKQETGRWLKFLAEYSHQPFR